MNSNPKLYPLSRINSTSPCVMQTILPISGCRVCLHCSYITHGSIHDPDNKTIFITVNEWLYSNGIDILCSLSGRCFFINPIQYGMIWAASRNKGYFGYFRSKFFAYEHYVWLSRWLSGTNLGSLQCSRVFAWRQKLCKQEALHANTFLFFTTKIFAWHSSYSLYSMFVIW